MVETSIENGRMEVKCPYSSAFIRAAKNMGGRWSSPYWVFDARDAELVKKALIEVYGEDGDTGTTYVTMKITFEEGYATGGSPIKVFNREIARATGRDSGARLGAGVILLSGRFSSGGSRINWTTCVEEEAVVLVRNVPLRLANRILESDWECEIVDETPIKPVEGSAGETCADSPTSDGE